MLLRLSSVNRIRAGIDSRVSCNRSPSGRGLHVLPNRLDIISNPILKKAVRLTTKATVFRTVFCQACDGCSQNV